MEKKVQNAVGYLLASLPGVALMLYALVARDENGDVTVSGAAMIVFGLVFALIGIATVRSRNTHKD